MGVFSSALGLITLPGIPAMQGAINKVL